MHSSEQLLSSVSGAVLLSVKQQLFGAYCTCVPRQSKTPALTTLSTVQCAVCARSDSQTAVQLGKVHILMCLLRCFHSTDDASGKQDMHAA